MVHIILFRMWLCTKLIRFGSRIKNPPNPKIVVYYLINTDQLFFYVICKPPNLLEFIVSFSQL